MASVKNASSDLTGLITMFGAKLEEAPRARFVEPEEVPEPYRSLLAHDEHMTVTMEDHYGAPVALRVLDALNEGEWYARKILLNEAKSGRIVQFGIMRFNFNWCSPEVREKIIEAEIPLGRILIEHDVLRRISTHALMEIRPNAELRDLFDMRPNAANGPRDEILYGRLATIFCNGEPAVDLLEIPAPTENKA